MNSSFCAGDSTSIVYYPGGRETYLFSQRFSQYQVHFFLLQLFFLGLQEFLLPGQLFRLLCPTHFLLPLLNLPRKSIIPLCCCWLIWPIRNEAKNLKNYWNPGIWVPIWEYSVRAFRWIPTWQGLDGLQRSLYFCALDESSLSIGSVTIDNKSQDLRQHRVWVSTQIPNPQKWLIPNILTMNF